MMKATIKILLIALFPVLLSGCAAKPVEFAAPYQQGNYQIVLLDIQPADKLKERIAKSQYHADEYLRVKKRIIDSIMPKLASKPSAPPIGLSIMLNDMKVETVNKGFIKSTLLLWHPQTRKKIAEMNVYYSEAAEKPTPTFYNAGAIGLVGTLITKAAIQVTEMTMKHIDGEEEIQRQVDVYTGTVMTYLYPVEMQENSQKNVAGNFLLGR